MGAEAQGQVPILLPAQVQAIGFGELGGIAIGCADHENQRLAFGYLLPADLALLQGDPGGGLNHAVVAKEFVDGGSDQSRVVNQAFAFAGIAQEGQHGVSDQVRRRLVPSDQDQHAHGKQLVTTQAIAVFAGLSQGAEQVVSRFGAALGDDTVEVLAHLAQTSFGSVGSARGE